MFKLDLSITKRYSVILLPEIERRSYSQETETTWERQCKDKKVHWKPVGGYKPNGLWYAFGRGWIDHYITYKYKLDSLLPPMFELNIDITKLAILSTPHDIKIFNSNFASKSDTTKDTINWSRVADHYSGIEINPFNREFSSLDWYNTFEISSGCLWDLRALRISRRVGPNDYKKIAL